MRGFQKGHKLLDVPLQFADLIILAHLSARLLWPIVRGERTYNCGRQIGYTLLMSVQLNGHAFHVPRRFGQSKDFFLQTWRKDMFRAFRRLPIRFRPVKSS